MAKGTVNQRMVVAPEAGKSSKCSLPQCFRQRRQLWNQALSFSSRDVCVRLLENRTGWLQICIVLFGATHLALPLHFKGDLQKLPEVTNQGVHNSNSPLQKTWNSAASLAFFCEGLSPNNPKCLAEPIYLSVMDFEWSLEHGKIQKVLFRIINLGVCCLELFCLNGHNIVIFIFKFSIHRSPEKNTSILLLRSQMWVSRMWLCFSQRGFLTMDNK